MSCLFDSLGRLSHEDPASVRQKICDYLQTNPDLMGDGTDARHVVRWETQKGLREYVRGMRDASTWGGSVEIKAFADMTGRGVIVHDRRPTTSGGGGGGGGARHSIKFRPREWRLRINAQVAHPFIEIYHLSWTGHHYEPLRRERIPLPQ